MKRIFFFLQPKNLSLFSIFIPVTLYANEMDKPIEFDHSLLYVNDANNVDISRFEKGATVLPGVYPADIYINNQLTAKDDISVTETVHGAIVICLTSLQIKRLGIDTGQLNEVIRNEMEDEHSCIDLTKGTENITLNLDVAAQRLDIIIPQAIAPGMARGTVSPELWDDGIPAMMLGYRFNGYQNRSTNGSTNSMFGDINAGLNIGQWYFRHNGTLSENEGEGTHYTSLNAYVQRDVTALKGTLKIGELNTSGQIFDSIPVKGAALMSDARMLPATQRGYAPEIHGTARTNARVRIKQNGRVIYEQSVTPGAFTISDLYPTGYGGNLDVEVQEADGQIQQFSVPYAALPQLLRPGQHRYEFTVGKLDDINISETPELAQLSYQRGLNNFITGYAGTQIAENYYSLQLGNGVSTPVGAFAFDVTHSQATLKDDAGKESGQSFKLSYSKFIAESSTNFSLAFFRFSTDGYFDFLQAARARHYYQDGSENSALWRQKSRTNVTASQVLPEGYGSFYISGYTQNYWNNDRTDLQYQFGYNNNFKSASYSVSAGRVRDQTGSMETNILLSVSMPLGSAETSHMPTVYANYSRNAGITGQQIGINGTAGQDNQFNYGASASHYEHGGSTGSVNGQYRTNYSTLSSAYTQGSNYHSASVGVSGTMLGYAGGIVTSPYIGDNFAIIEADGAEGARVGNYSVTRVNSWGRAAVPYLNPYELNTVSIDPLDASDNLEFKTTTQRVAPRSGAISLISFKTHKGLLYTSKVTNKDGKTIPFGAMVYDSNGNTIGSVGQSGLLYAMVQKEEGKIHIKWGQHEDISCEVKFKVQTGSRLSPPSICN